jgi:serine/threonine protein kinase
MYMYNYLYKILPHTQPCTYTLPPSPQTLCHYTKQLLEALSYLHSQGIVHNDLRPSLVFLDGGGVNLGGFSIVKRYNMCM